MELVKTFSVGLSGGYHEAFVKLDSLVNTHLGQIGEKFEIKEVEDAVWPRMPKLPGNDGSPAVTRRVVFRKIR